MDRNRKNRYLGSDAGARRPGYSFWRDGPGPMLAAFIVAIVFLAPLHFVNPDGFTDAASLVQSGLESGAGFDTAGGVLMVLLVGAFAVMGAAFSLVLSVGAHPSFGADLRMGLGVVLALLGAALALAAFVLLGLAMYGVLT